MGIRRNDADRGGAALGRTARILAGALALGSAFGAGAFVERSAWDGGAAADGGLAAAPEFAVLEQTWTLIQDEWVDPDGIDREALIYGAAAGMVDALGDEGHSRFMDPETARSFREANENAYTGIGVEIDFRGDRPRVVAPIDGSPAAEAGIRSGDVLLEIDGQDTSRMDIDGVADLLLGEAGLPVRVTVLSEGADGPRDLELVRARIAIEPVSWRMLPGNVAQLRLSQFSQDATGKVKTALGEIRAAGADAVVLDLRDNPGGLLTEAIGVASQFLPEGSTIFRQENRDGSINPVRTVGRTGLWQEGPLAVLINGGSSSAAEIVGGALSDNGRASSFGETTYGTGTVLIPFEQADGSVVLLGTAFWLTPDGERVWKEGVTPDREVPLPFDADPSRPGDDPDLSPADFAASGDVQLRAAWESLADEPASVLATPAAS